MTRRRSRCLSGLILGTWLSAVPAAADTGRPWFGRTAPAETLVEIRIHGNHTTPDAVVLELAGLTVGQAIDGTTLAAAERRLQRSGRFQQVEIRKRYRSLDPGGDVAFVILVREHPVPDETIQGPAPLRPFKRLFASGMFLPILSYTDGYGLTYGARFSFVDTLGRGGRVSVPLSWGGTKRAAVEVEKKLARGPVDQIVGGLAVWRRTNPAYELDEDRREIWIGASRRIASHLFASGNVRYGRVEFGALAQRLTTAGGDLTFDTRIDPVFPRNAVFARIGAERVQPAGADGANRLRLDVRGYRGLVRQAVLSVRLQGVRSDGALPPYERLLLGGASTLRGYGAGSFSGDNLLVASAEVRVPLGSPMGISRAGVSVFGDVGTVWDHGTRLADARGRRGAGAGVFLLASLFQLSLDVGIRQGGGVHVHFSTGLQF